VSDPQTRTKKEKERLFARHDALFELLQRLEKRVDALDAKHVGADYAAKQAQLMHAARRKAIDGHGPLITGDWHINEGETEELRDDAMEILCLAGNCVLCARACVRACVRVCGADSHERV
jgi:hypothetical protein